MPAAGEENFAVWVQNHEIRAVWGVRKWCWLPKSGVSQAYSNTWPRAGVSLGQHLAHLSVSLPVLTPVKRWKRSPGCSDCGRDCGVQVKSYLKPPSAALSLPAQCLLFTGIGLVYEGFLILFGVVWYGGIRKWYGSLIL